MTGVSKCPHIIREAWSRFDTENKNKIATATHSLPKERMYFMDTLVGSSQHSIGGPCVFVLVSERVFHTQKDGVGTHLCEVHAYTCTLPVSPGLSSPLRLYTHILTQPPLAGEQFSSPIPRDTEV